MAKSATEMILPPLVPGCPGCAVAQLCGEQGSLLIIIRRLWWIKDGRSRRILTEWVEAYVQDRVEAAEDTW